MSPEGYRCTESGRVRTERGHVGFVGISCRVYFEAMRTMCDVKILPEQKRGTAYWQHYLHRH